MAKIAYGIIDVTKYDTCLEFFEKNSLLDDVIYATNRKSKLTENLKNTIDVTNNAPEDRNKIIKKAKDLGYDIVFVFDDNLMPSTIDIFQKYVEKMEFYDIGMIFYGYGKGCNRTLGIKPNPGVALQIDPLTELQVSRFVCDSMIGIDLRKHCELFDERLKFTYFKEYVARLATNKIIPFNGFFIDVEDSWKYFTETAVHISKAEMEQNSILFRQEQQILQNENIQNNIDNKIDNFIQFVYEVQSKKRGLTLDSIDTPALELQQ